MFSGLHNRHVRRITFRVDPARRSTQGISINKRLFLIRVCFGCGGILSCSDWHKIVLLFPLHIACNFESYAAHRTPPISAVCCQKQQQQKTPRAQQYSARRVL